MPTVLFIDTNEFSTNPAIVTQISKSFTVLPLHLETGDINIPLPNGKLIVIERKQPQDLLSSIGDGRLFDQCERMVTKSPFSFIVINGGIYYNKDDMVEVDGQVTKWHGKSVRNALLAVQLGGCVVTYTVHVGLVDVIAEIVDLCSKPDHNPSVRKERALAFPPIDSRVELLAQFPGVGLKRAEALLRWVNDVPTAAGVLPDEDFGDLCNAIEWATMMPLLSEEAHPEGWGKVTVANFRTMLGLGPDEYLCVRKEIPDAKRPEVTPAQP